jgi:hypothetical protein
MAPEQRKERRKAPRHEYEVAYYTEELGRPLQRQMLQRRFDEIREGTISAASSHADEASRESEAAPPREDRAG